MKQLVIEPVDAGFATFVGAGRWPPTNKKQAAEPKILAR